MSDADRGELSPADSSLCEIIDGFSNRNYALWNVSVKFGMPIPLILLQLQEMFRRRSAAEDTVTYDFT